MDALLANAGTSATPQPAAQEETKAAAGKGIGKGGSLKGNLEQLLKLLATLVVVHDREIQDPKDMRSIALIVPDQAVKQQISFYASTRTYAPVMAAHGWEDIVPQLNEHSRKGQWPAMAELISDEMLAEFAVIGRRHEVGDLLREKYTGVLDRIGIYMPFRPGSDDGWWQDVIAAVKK